MLVRPQQPRNSTTMIGRTLKIRASVTKTKEFTSVSLEVEEFTAAEIPKPSTETTLSDSELQLQVQQLLPKLLNNLKAYLTFSRPNEQIIYVNSRDAKEVNTLVKRFSKAGFSGNFYKNESPGESPAGHYIIKLNTSLRELVLRLQESVKPAQVQQDNNQQEDSLNSLRRRSKL